MIVLNPDAKPTDDTLVLPTAVHLRPIVSHPPTDPELPAYDTLSIYDPPKRKPRLIRARLKRFVKIAVITGLVYLVITIIAITIVKKRKDNDDDDNGPQNMNRHDIDHRTRERTSDAPYPPINISEKEGTRIACNAWSEKANSSELRLSYTFPPDTSNIFLRSIGGIPIAGSLIVLADTNVDDLTVDVIYHSSVMRPKDLVDVCLMRKSDSTVGLGIYTTSTVFIKNMQPSIFSLILRIPGNPNSTEPLILGNFDTVLPFFTQTFLDLRGKVTFHNVNLAGLGTDVFITQSVQAHKFSVESKRIPKTFGGGGRRRSWGRSFPFPRPFRRLGSSKLQPRR
jgi:hypothetical protein